VISRSYSNYLFHSRFQPERSNEGNFPAQWKTAVVDGVRTHALPAFTNQTRLLLCHIAPCTCWLRM